MFLDDDLINSLKYNKKNFSDRIFIKTLIFTIDKKYFYCVKKNHENFQMRKGKLLLTVYENIKSFFFSFLMWVQSDFKIFLKGFRNWMKSSDGPFVSGIRKQKFWIPLF